jgi:hypothetical protein
VKAGGRTLLSSQSRACILFCTHRFCGRPFLERLKRCLRDAASVHFFVSTLAPFLQGWACHSQLEQSSPLPEIQLGCVFSVPFGLMVHPSMAVPTHRLVTSSDDGVGTWRLILRSWVHFWPEWSGCSSPRGSTRPSGTCLAHVYFGSAGRGRSGGRNWCPSVEVYSCLENLVDTPQHHSSHDQAPDFRATALCDTVVCLLVPR